MPTDILTDYIDPAYLTRVPFGKRSWYQNPLRAYLDTWPTARMQTAFGLCLNVSPAQAGPVCQLAASRGITRARIDCEWGDLEYSAPTQIVPAKLANYEGYLAACRAWGIRPLLLLNANDGGPCPYLGLNIILSAPAPAGATTVSLGTITDGNAAVHAASSLPLGQWGFTGVTPGTNVMAECLVTALSANVATLSKPLPAALAAGTHLGAALAYAPFFAYGTAQYNATLAGWEQFVAAFCAMAKAAMGGTSTDCGFDIEIWNELSFGSNFLDGTNYYGGPPPGGAVNGNDSRYGILAASVAAVSPVTYPGVLTGNGFSNTEPFYTGSGPHPPIASGQASPAGLGAVDIHTYPPVRQFTTGSQAGVETGNPAVDALGNSDASGFVPTVFSCYPECFLGAFATETAIRGMSPVMGTLGGAAQGRSAHPLNPDGSAARTPETWITEMGMSATLLPPRIPGLALLTAAQQTVLAAVFLARMTLRAATFIHKGASRMYYYACQDAEPYGFGLVSQAFLAAASAGAFPAGSSALESPALPALSRLLAALPAGTVTTPRTVGLSQLSETHGHTQWTGDGTPAHPDLRNLDCVVLSPYQETDTALHVLCYVATIDCAQSYGPLTNPDGSVNAAALNLPDEVYTLALTGLPAYAALVAALYDPLTNTTLAAPTIVSTGTGTATITLPLTDTPRVLSLSEGAAGSALPAAPGASGSPYTTNKTLEETFTGNCPNYLLWRNRFAQTGGSARESGMIDLGTANAASFYAAQNPGNPAQGGQDWTGTNLSLLAQPAVPGGSDGATAIAFNTLTDAAGAPLPYQGGMLSGDGQFAQRYGWFETTVILPATHGAWFTAALASRDGNSKIILVDCLSGSVTGGNAFLPLVNGQLTEETFAYPGNLADGNPHTYAVQWEPGSLTYYVDGAQVHQLTANIPQQKLAWRLTLAAYGPASDPRAPTSPSTFSASATLSSLNTYQNQAYVPALGVVEIDAVQANVNSAKVRVFPVPGAFDYHVRAWNMTTGTYADGRMKAFGRIAPQGGWSGHATRFVRDADGLLVYGADGQLESAPDVLGIGNERVAIPSQEGEVNGLPPGGGVYVIEALARPHGFPQASLYTSETPPTAKYPLAPMDASMPMGASVAGANAAMLGGNMGLDTSGTYSVTNGQSNPTTLPLVLARSRPFTLTPTGSAPLLGVAGATHEFLESFDGGTVTDTTALVAAQSAANAQGIANNRVQLGTVNTTLNGAPHATVNYMTQFSVAGMFAHFLSDRHGMVIHADSDGNDGHGAMLLELRADAGGASLAADITGGRVAHLQYQVDSTDTSRRWPGLFLTPAASPPLIGFYPNFGFGVNNPVNSINEAVQIDFFEQNVNCIFWTPSTVNSGVDPESQVVSFLRPRHTRAAVYTNLGVGSNQPADAEKGNWCGRGQDNRTTFSVLMSRTELAIYEDGILIGTCSRTAPFTWADVVCTPSLYIYHTSLEVPEDIETYEPYLSQIADLMPYSMEWHYNQFLVRSLPAPAGGDVTTYSTLVQPPAYVPPAFAGSALPASSVALTAAPSPAGEGVAVTLLATVTGASPTGMVTFFDGGSVLQTVALTPVAGSSTQSAATLLQAFLIAGVHTLTASYAGNSANAPSASASAPVNLTVTAPVPVATGSVLSVRPNPAVLGGPVILTATVAPLTGTSAPSGTVTFEDNGVPIGPAQALSAGGVASLTVSGLAAGSHSLTALYSGASGAGASPGFAVSESAPVALVINSTPPKIATFAAFAANPNPVPAGGTATVSVTVAPQTGLGTPTGSVEVFDNPASGAALLGTVTLIGGSASLPLLGLASGAHLLSAAYSGDGTYAPAASGQIALSVLSAQAARSTVYPFRQALTFMLRSILLKSGAPAINAALASQMQATDPATVPQFTQANVTEGDLLAVSEPTICVVAGSDADTGAATGTYMATFITQFRLKVPAVGDNAPEDYALLFAVVEDTLRDLFNDQTNQAIAAVNPATGVAILPQNSSFTACMILRCDPAQWPISTAEGIQRVAGLVLTHTASINYSLTRPGAVGGTGPNA